MTATLNATFPSSPESSNIQNYNSKSFSITKTEHAQLMKAGIEPDISDNNDNIDNNDSKLNNLNSSENTKDNASTPASKISRRRTLTNIFRVSSKHSGQDVGNSRTSNSHKQRKNSLRNVFTKMKVAPRNSKSSEDSSGSKRKSRKNEKIKSSQTAPSHHTNNNQAPSNPFIRSDEHNLELSQDMLPPTNVERNNMNLDEASEDMSSFHYEEEEEEEEEQQLKKNRNQQGDSNSVNSTAENFFTKFSSPTPSPHFLTATKKQTKLKPVQFEGANNEEHTNDEDAQTNSSSQPLDTTDEKIAISSTDNTRNNVDYNDNDNDNDINKDINNENNINIGSGSDNDTILCMKADNDQMEKDLKKAIFIPRLKAEGDTRSVSSRLSCYAK
eukprot:Awhi_evm3s13717